MSQLTRTVNSRVLAKTSSSRTLARSSSTRTLQRVIGSLSLNVSTGAGAPQSGTGSPVGVVTPDFAGQFYKDNSTGQVYYAFTTSSADWIELLRNY